MPAVFSKAAPLILAAEGGYQDGKNDYGGETRYGISSRQYPNVDIKNLTIAKALAILEADYWKFYHLSDIDDQNVANQVFLLLVNMNPVNAVKILQIAINAVGRTIISVRVDGELGTLTFQAINSLAPFWLCDRIRLEACRYYLMQVDDDKSQQVNFLGWIRRVLA